MLNNYLWIYLSVFAASAQIIRMSLQKHLKKDLSDMTITWARYFYGLPFILIFYLALIGFKPSLLFISINIQFLTFCMLAGISQIYATKWLLEVFGTRNFAVGISYSKLEAIFTGIFGLIIFGTPISLVGFVAIIFGLLGVLLISAFEQKFPSNLLKTIGGNAAKKGLLSATSFAFCALFIKEANQTLILSNNWQTGCFTLLITVFLQTTYLTIFLYKTEREELHKAFKMSKKIAPIGFFSFLGSVGWFVAISYTNPAYVKTVGQIDLIFAGLISRRFFKEDINKGEYIGMLIIFISIILMLFV